MPPGATGDVYRAAVDEVVAPLAEEIGATWLLLSAGFDGHRADPLTDLGLTSGDFADVTAAVRRSCRRAGGWCSWRVATTWRHCATHRGGAGRAGGGEAAPERPTGGGPGREVVAAAEMAHPGPAGVSDRGTRPQCGHVRNIRDDLGGRATLTAVGSGEWPGVEPAGTDGHDTPAGRDAAGGRSADSGAGPDAPVVLAGRPRRRRGRPAGGAAAWRS